MKSYDVADIASNPVDASVKVRLFLDAVVALILLVRLFTGITSWLRPIFRGLFGMLTVFVLIALTTTLWSVKPYWTFYKSAEYGLDVALVVAVAISVKSLAEYRLLLNWAYGLCGALVGLAMVEAIFAPRLAFDYGPTGALSMPELTGVFPAQAANGLGTLGAIIAIVALYRLMSKSEQEGKSWLVPIGFWIWSGRYVHDRGALCDRSVCFRRDPLLDFDSADSRWNATRGRLRVRPHGQWYGKGCSRLYIAGPDGTTIPAPNWPH